MAKTTLIKAMILMLLTKGQVINAKENAKSDHYDGTHFYNLYLDKDSEKGFLAYWKWQFLDGPKSNTWPKHVENVEVAKLPDSVKAKETYITAINHATELIQLRNLTILTDPIFSERASPLKWYGPHRIRAAGLDFNKLPKIDVVIISHNHYDHLDLPSIKRLIAKFNPLFIVPLKNKQYLEGVGVNRCIELDWWQEYKLNERQSITLLPAQHWSKRTLFDKNEALWGSYLIVSDDLKLYYIGDTGYSPHIQLIKDRVGRIDISFIPIGAYKPRWFMKPYHINPEEAVLIHSQLESQLSIAIQFDTFQLANERYGDAEIDLKAALKKHQVSEDVFITPSAGKTIHFKK